MLSNSIIVFALVVFGSVPATAARNRQVVRHVTVTFETLPTPTSPGFDSVHASKVVLTTGNADFAVSTTNQPKSTVTYIPVDNSTSTSFTSISEGLPTSGFQSVRVKSRSSNYVGGFHWTNQTSQWVPTGIQGTATGLHIAEFLQTGSVHIPENSMKDSYTTTTYRTFSTKIGLYTRTYSYVVTETLTSTSIETSTITSVGIKSSTEPGLVSSTPTVSLVPSHDVSLPVEPTTTSTSTTTKYITVTLSTRSFTKFTTRRFTQISDKTRPTPSSHI